MKIYSILSSVTVASGGVPRAIYSRMEMLHNLGHETIIITLAKQRLFEPNKKKMTKLGIINPNIKIINIFDLAQIPQDFHYKYKYRRFKKKVISNDKQGKLITYSFLSSKVIEKYDINEKLCSISFLKKNVEFQEIVTANGVPAFVFKKEDGIYRDGYTLYTKFSFNKPQELYAELLKNEIKDNSIVFSEFRDVSLKYLYGGGLDDIVLSLDQNVRKFALLHTTHLDYPYNNINIINKEFKKLLDRAHQFEQIIVLTEEQKEDIKKVFNIDNIQVISHYIEVPKIEHEKINFSDVICVTRPGAIKKNFELVIDIAREIKLRNLDFKILIYGKNADEVKAKEYQKIIREEKLEVHFKGSTTKLAKIIAESRCVIVPSLAEGQSLGILEAILLSCPCVAKDLKYGAKEIIHEGKNGFIIKSDENLVKNFVDKIIETSELDRDSKDFGIVVCTYQDIIDKWNKLII